MHSEILKYDANGLHLESHLYFDPAKSGKRPGILVFPEAFGLSDHTKEKAQRLAELGYVTLANDLFGEGKIVTSMDEVMGFVGPMMQDPLKTRAYAQAGLQALLARPEVDSAKIAAIGYCFGGTVSLELARGGNAVKGVAGFHSGLGTARPEDAKNIKGKVLVCIGADDPIIPPAQRAAFEDEMKAAGADWRLQLYGGAGHSFTNPAADSRGMKGFFYHEATDRRSWNAMIELFEETLN